MSNFITNQSEKNLAKRLSTLISYSKEFRALVGFFYFSGVNELIESIKDNKELQIKILVGLNVDKINSKIVEMDFSKKQSENDSIKDFLQSIVDLFNADESDNEQQYNNAKYFIQLIQDGRLDIRKTREPNHSKLYLFDLKEDQVYSNSFITGSSNLTKSGLNTQNEFNVELTGFGYQEASDYFEELWKNAIKITEKVENKDSLLSTLQNKTQIKEITPFEAYCYVLKSYLDSLDTSGVDKSIEQLILEKGYKKYQYQVDAIKQAVPILKNHNGIMLADVVGLGKSIMATIVARLTGRRGIVICPPGLVGNKEDEGWRGYLNQFDLKDWRVFSSGKLDDALQFVRDNQDYEVVIIDEVHKFRNEKTETYETLKTICNGKKVIALTATPFNNKPQDLLSIIKLFITPKKSSISLEDDISVKFMKISSQFNKLHYILKNEKKDDKKIKKKIKDYKKHIFGNESATSQDVKSKIRELAKYVREIIEPVTIRRNRKDLEVHPVYNKEINELSKTKDPEQIYFYLNEHQNIFYDSAITTFNHPSEGGKFNGACYLPYLYKYGVSLKEKDDEDVDDDDIFSKQEFVTQTNLFSLMQRLLVRRFESSFGAFVNSLDNFKRFFEIGLSFIERQNKYILNTKLMQTITELMDSDEYVEGELTDAIQDKIKELLDEYENNPNSRKSIIYDFNDNFKEKEKFIEDIQKDIALIDYLKMQIDKLQLFDKDPKTYRLFDFVQESLKQEPNRKILVFTEFADTVHFIKSHLEKHNPNLFQRTLFVSGNIGSNLKSIIFENFDTAYKGQQKNDYDLIITTDKLSEGYNLNRAGTIVNYDIPWNPVRVIQRIGRINRISKKVFDELRICNFFPNSNATQYADPVAVASNKMFMIHQILGEDVKIFSSDEEPTAAALFDRLNQNPDDIGEESLYTKIYREFEQIKNENPDILERIYSIPNRTKVAKSFNNDNLTIFYKRNRLFVQHFNLQKEEFEPVDVLFDDIIANVRAKKEEKGLSIDNFYWKHYDKAINYHKKPSLSQTLTPKGKIAWNKLALIFKNLPALPVEQIEFVKDLQIDIEKYGTLSDYTINSISQLDLDNIDNLQNQIINLIGRLGADFLKSVKSQTSEEKEIILSILNKKETN